MLNSFSGIGRLGSDPETRNNNGTMIASFDVAINEFFKKDNDLKKRTHWIPCICYGRLAEIAGEFLTKGSLIGVRGPLKLDQWEDTNGKKSSRLRVHIIEFEFLSSRSYDDQPSEQEGI